MKIAVFPGSFDPITKGHEMIVEKATEIFDVVIIAIGINDSKKYMYSLEERVEFIQKTFGKKDSLLKITIKTYDGLTVDFCKEKGATHIVRGVRTAADFEFERQVAVVNKEMNPDVETVLFFCPPELSAVSSSLVREILKHGGDVSKFVPDCGII